jgi:hypothetical protein
MARASILYLYKCILRSAREYPSIRREAIIQEIKLGTVAWYFGDVNVVLITITDFRKNASLTDQEKILKAVHDGIDGLRALQKYTGSNASSSFTVNLS